MSVDVDRTLSVGDRVRLGHGSGSALRWWTVRAADERFVVLNRTAAFSKEKEYTIIDWDRGVRGPCNLIGQGWDTDGDGAAELLRALQFQLEVVQRLEAGEKSVPMTEPAVEVTYRNNVPVLILEVDA